MAGKKSGEILDICGFSYKIESRPLNWWSGKGDWMRVIAGKAKGRKLVTRESDATRPTADRMKEALFSSIQFSIAGSRFLDIFAGSGAIGIEALSRGAAYAAFIESEEEALSCIRQNLKALDFQNQAELIGRDVYSALRELSARGETFDIVFLAPPYRQGHETRCLDAIRDFSLLAETGFAVVESASETEIAVDGMICVKEKRYRTTKFSFFELAEGGE